jgi:hypothetical protein
MVMNIKLHRSIDIHGYDSPGVAITLKTARVERSLLVNAARLYLSTVVDGASARALVWNWRGKLLWQHAYRVSYCTKRGGYEILGIA